MDDGHHTVNISVLVNYVSLDYIFITPSPATSLSNEILMVDDSYPTVLYKGADWKELAALPEPEQATPFELFQNSAHSTSTKGDSFQFSFAGTLPLDKR